MPIDHHQLKNGNEKLIVQIRKQLQQALKMNARTTKNVHLNLNLE